MHVIVDGHGGDPDQLSDENVVRVILDQVPGMMGMSKITQPKVLRYTGSKPEDWGVSGFVMIAESHISIHTWPNAGYAALDVFMCGKASPDACIPVLREAFKAQRVEVSEILRGQGA